MIRLSLSSYESAANVNGLEKDFLSRIVKIVKLNDAIVAERISLSLYTPSCLCMYFAIVHL
jgi:hypothetical protein